MGKMYVQKEKLLEKESWPRRGAHGERKMENHKM